MNIISRFSTWWKAIIRREQLSDEIEDELAFHIENYAEDLMRDGLPREEAVRRARVELGSIASQKESCRSAWGARFWDELYADIRHGLRMLAKSPSFTAIAIGSLALGIGANTVIFTLTKEVLLDKLGVQAPEQLRLFGWDKEENSVVHWESGTDAETPTGKTIDTSFSYPIYKQLRQQNRVLEDVFAFKNLDRITATIGGQSEVIEGTMVSRQLLPRARRKARFRARYRRCG